MSTRRSASSTRTGGTGSRMGWGFTSFSPSTTRPGSRWAARRGRRGFVGGFAAVLALLCLASFAVLPAWLPEMLGATRRTPPPTDYFPWIGTTWYLLLKGAGLRSWGLQAAYAAVALPFLGAVARAAL